MKHIDTLLLVIERLEKLKIELLSEELYTLGIDEAISEVNEMLGES